MFRFSLFIGLLSAALAACSALPANGQNAASTPAQSTASPSAPLALDAYPAGAKIKIACVGDSITLGAGTSPTRGTPINGYPGQLQRMLGDRFDVRNFGVSGTTLLSHADRPYIKANRYHPSLDFKPDVVLIMLGTNDTKTEPNNWQFKNEFAADYRALAQTYLALESHPRVFACYPNFVPENGAFTINDPAVLEEIAMIDTVAKELHLGIINVHDAMKPHAAEIVDHVHPNNQGAMALAGIIYQSLLGKPYTGPSTIQTAAPSSRNRAAATQR
jgi:lysophospholipase L1-like esterase